MANLASVWGTPVILGLILHSSLFSYIYIDWRKQAFMLLVIKMASYVCSIWKHRKSINTAIPWLLAADVEHYCTYACSLSGTPPSKIQAVMESIVNFERGESLAVWYRRCSLFLHQSQLWTEGLQDQYDMPYVCWGENRANLTIEQYCKHRVYNVLYGKFHCRQ